MASGATYNPANVMFGRPSGGSNMVRTGPYVWNGASSGPPMPGPPKERFPGGSVGIDPKQYQGGGASTTVPAPAQPSSTGVVGPRTVRATGSGPFDSAYRQNLASYAGGQFAGNLSFNPTDINSFPGNPTGGGTAPVSGMPTSLMDMALAGQGFSWAPPAPAATATKPPNYGDMQSWMDQFMRNGRGMRMGSFA